MIKQIPIDQIVVSECRYRSEFDETKLDELANSIGQLGLIHPVVVRASHGKFVLVAGERRLRAVKKLHTARHPIPTHEPPPFDKLEFWYIQAHIIETSGPLQALEMELDENLRRADLNWREVAKATALIHEMRTKGQANWTPRDTAVEMGNRGFDSNQTRTAQRITLASYLDTPEIASASSEREALKKLAKTLERNLQSEIFKQVGEQFYDDLILRAVDFREGLKTVPAGSVDVLLTDPPYGIDAENFGIDSVREVHHYTDTWESAYASIRDLVAELNRVCTPQAHAYMFCDYTHFEEIAELFRTVGWEVWPRPLIWAKNNGYTPKPDFGPRYCYECILFANRNRKPVLKIGQSDVLHYAPPTTERIHAAQKPVYLLQDLLARSAFAGNTVLDPFCGGAPIIEASRALGVKVIAFDKDTSIITQVYDRLEKGDSDDSTTASSGI